jgi:hypothetical protein
MIMQEFFESETSWLTLTNIALGVVTLACIVAVARTAFMELAERARSRARIPAWQDDHAFVLSDLGVTMADGGDAVDEWDPRANTKAIDPNRPDSPAADPK